MLSQEPRACMTLPLEGGQWSLILNEGLGQQEGSPCLRSSDQRGKGSPGLLPASQDIQLVTSLPPPQPQKRGKRYREKPRGEG